MKNIDVILKEYWGHDNYRPLQKEIITSVLEGRDTLAVMPTGGGKSICFQVPSLAVDGICLVISPLIALMKDQVENLKKRGIPSLMIHSGLKRADLMQTLKNATNNYFKFLYVSPERLETSLFLEFLPAFNVNLIAVDEAHCISQWGYDFRPSYLRIAALRKELPGVPVLALTASATPEVQKDICEQLSFQKSRIFCQSFERKNLSYSVFKADSKMAKLVHILSRVPGSVIVYCKSRKRTGELMQLLLLQGISASQYHAGLSQEDRSQRQKDWINNKVRVMVCTNAFGMGIDKPDVRLVVHIDVPDCLENYYQEAGRAGRDGQKAYAVLLYSDKEIADLESLHLIRFPSSDQIRKVYHALVNFLQIPSYTGENQYFDFQFDSFVRQYHFHSREALYALKALEQDGWIDFNEKYFSPSTVVFTTTKKLLYDFEKEHPDLETVITTLLRTYEGIFDFPAMISEGLLARLLNREETQLCTQLKSIASFGIINYLPQNEVPKIIFRKNRVPASELQLNLEAYHKRKDKFLERIGTMVSYIKTKNCRSNFISFYFGDKDGKDCGTCDECLHKKAVPLSAEEVRQISLLITNRIALQPVTTTQLLHEIRNIKKEKAWKVIEFLQAENKITFDKVGVLRLK